ncbi:MAG: 2-hydroxychromene-2-carboxylate isomerase [Alphaproteobacteria bacterium]
MAVTAEFIFDFGSPNAYLSHRVLPAIAARTGVPFVYVPALLGGIFKATGNVSPMVAFAGIKNKLEYQALETRRFLAAHGIDDYVRNPDFPINTLQIMRGAIAAKRLDCYAAYVDAVFDHMWRRPKKMDEPETIRAAFLESGLPADDLIAGMQAPEVKSELVANTEAAVARGVFGSPSFFVDGALYFGKDRLEAVEAEILRRKAA